MKITMSGEDANNMIEAAFALGVFMEKNKWKCVLYTNGIWKFITNK